MITYGCSINLLPMDYDKFINLTDEQREDWEQLREYIAEHTKVCRYSLNMLEDIKDIYKRLKKGYNKSRIEIILDKCLEVFGLKARGVNKKFDMLHWRIECIIPIYSCFDWTNYSNIKKVYNELFCFYSYNFK